MWRSVLVRLRVRPQACPHLECAALQLNAVPEAGCCEDMVSGEGKQSSG